MSDILLKIGGDTTGLTKAFKKATEDSKGFENSMMSLGKKLLGAFAFTAAVRGIKDLISTNSQLIDSLAKTADNLNVTTENLSALHHIAKLNGQSQEQLDKSLTKLNLSLGEIASGGGAMAQKSLEKLGLSYASLSGMTADEKFLTVASNLDNLASASDRAFVTSQLFGRNNLNVLKTLEDLNTNGIDPTREKLAKLGVSFSRIEASQVEAANDAFEELGLIMQGIGTQLAISVAPFVQALSQYFLDAATEGEGFGAKVGKMFAGLARIGGVFGDGLHAIGLIFKGLILGGNTFGVAIMQVLSLVAEGITMTVDNALGKINTLISVANNIPAIDIPMIPLTGQSEAMKVIRGMTEEATNSLNNHTQAWMDAAAAVTPSQKVEEYLNKVNELKNAPSDLTPMQEGTTGNPVDVKAQDNMKSKLEALEQSLMSERELILASQEQQLEDLRLFEENKLITKEEMLALEAEVKAKSEEDLYALGADQRRKEADDILLYQQALNDQEAKRSEQALADKEKFWEGMNNLANNGSRAAFNIAKLQAVANAVVEGYQAAVSSYRYGAAIGGPPVGAAFAAASIASTGSMIRGIKSSQFNSGGSAANVAKGSATATNSQVLNSAATGQTPGGPNINVSLVGSNFSRQQVSDLITQINDQVRNGGKVRVGT